MDTVPDLITAFGGPAAFSRALGVNPSTASEMKRSGRIEVDYWPTIMQKAKERGLRGVHEAMLTRINLAKPRRRIAQSYKRARRR